MRKPFFVLASVILLAASSLFTISFLADVAEAHEGQQQSCGWHHPGYTCSNARPIYSCYSSGYIACHGSSSCNDGSTGTTDTCSNADSTSSFCSYSSCAANTADVNDAAGDGCEVDLLTDENNCGSVGNVCSGNLACASGTCVDLTSDENNCGSVGNACSTGEECLSSACTQVAEFTIGLDPTSGTANKGDSKNINVSLDLTSATTGSTSFSASGLPNGASIAFSPTSCSPTCYSDATITTTNSIATGSSIITITGTSGSNTDSATYTLTILSDSVPNCGNNVCETPETQSTCSNDCATTANIPSPVSPGETVTVEVEFHDFRYSANGKVQIDMTINPEGTSWTPLNGCFFGGKKMGASAGGGTIAWPGNTISENGHFKISTTCTLPSSIAAGAHTLIATPTIF